MVDVVRVKPPERARGRRCRRRSPAAFAPFNLQGKSRCRPAAGAAGRHISDNHKSQNPQACIRRTIERTPKECHTGEGPGFSRRN